MFSLTVTSVIMPPKQKIMSKRNEGADNAFKRPPRKAAKTARFSAPIQQDLDNEEEVMGNRAFADPGLDMANTMDIMMTMLFDLTNKVNGQEKEPGG